MTSLLCWALATVTTMWLGTLASLAQPSGLPPSCETDFVREVLTPGITGVTLRGWPGVDPVIPDSRLLTALRNPALSSGKRVLAVAFSPNGPDNRAIIIFTRSDAGVDLVATFVWWGEVAAKRRCRISEGELQRFLQEVDTALPCRRISDERFLSIGVAYWDATGSWRFCEAAPLSREETQFVGLLNSLLAGSVAVYSNPQAGRVGLPRLTPVTKVEPEFPPDALRKGLEATVLVGGEVDAAGRVTDLRIIQSTIPGSGFEEAALEAVSAWRYPPAWCEEASPLPVTVRIDFGAAKTRRPESRRPSR